jgi:transposase-like protein
VRILTFNRPESRNALNRARNSDPAFCAGVDLREFGNFGTARGVPDHSRATLLAPKQANVLAPLQKSAHPGALTRSGTYNAEDIDKAQVATKAFAIDYGANNPKAVAKIVDDADVLLEFYNYPAEHWVHLRTTNPIEGTLAVRRLRIKVTRGPGSRAARIAMAYKLIDAA